jgi:predicted neuraminidase
MGVFAELLRLDADGRVVHKQRLSWGRSTLQPVIVARNEMEATGFLRRFGSAPRQLHGVHTSDGGRTWTAPKALDLPNPGAPVAAARLDSGELKVVFNNTHKGRTDLTLALSPDDGATWQILRAIDGDGRRGSSKDICYPALVPVANGEFHVLYTANLKQIRHVHLNAAWLEQNR